jgi:LacI family transcriptional regulator
MIGLVLPHSVSSVFADPYFPLLIKGIAQACNQNEYSLGLFLVSAKEDEEKIFLQVSRKGMLDGVIVQSGHHGEPMIGRLIDSMIPLVLMGRPFQPENISYIDVDNVNAVYNAVGYLIRLGYRRIGTITGPAKSTVGIDRKEGYLRALAERGRTFDPSLLAEGDFTESGGYYAMKKLLPSKPDAIFAASDTMAIGAMRAVREAGLTVPDDIAFVGFDDLPLPNSPDPALTTVRQPILQFSRTAVEILLDLIENGVNPPRHIILDTELIIRESCGASHR